MASCVLITVVWNRHKIKSRHHLKLFVSRGLNNGDTDDSFTSSGQSLSTLSAMKATLLETWAVWKRTSYLRTQNMYVRFSWSFESSNLYFLDKINLRTGDLSKPLCTFRGELFCLVFFLCNWLFEVSNIRSPSLGACNYPIFLSRSFHRPIYF